VSGQYLVKNGISVFACSETQKFGHVTFFWNGNRSGYFDNKLETYLEVGRAAKGEWGVMVP
jgi:2,3-bisphosphoglycerate-independent phosphoglycerate mutase